MAPVGPVHLLTAADGKCTSARVAAAMAAARQVLGVILLGSLGFLSWRMRQRCAGPEIFVQDDLADDVHALAKRPQERVVVRTADAQGIG